MGCPRARDRLHVRAALRRPLVAASRARCCRMSRSRPRTDHEVVSPMERRPPNSRRKGVRRLTAWLPALAGVLVLLGCSHDDDRGDRAPAEAASSEAVPEAVTEPGVDLTLDCTGRRASADTFDYAAPRTASQARRQGWPETPMMAVEGMPGSPNFERLEVVSLSDPVRSTTHGRVSVQFAALTADGATVAVVTVDPLVGGFWSVGQLQQCALGANVAAAATRPLLAHGAILPRIGRRRRLLDSCAQ